MQNTLDLSIKAHETGTVQGAYITQKSYPSYMSNAEWSHFVGEMEQKFPTAFAEYGAGAGGELKEKGSNPPKMASYGSSSRMIYLLSRDIPDFHFERKLSTTVGGTANLDGCLETDNAYIFVEAKCREPYGAKSHFVEKKYERLYKFINDDKTNNLSIQTEVSGTKMKTVFSAGEMTISNFDIKQMICHLLGIATMLLKNPTQKKVSFLYLCYNPRLIEITDRKKEISIFDTYDRMCAECAATDFKSLFASVVSFLVSEKNTAVSHDDIKRMTDSFAFSLCDQSNYLNKIK